MTGIHFRNIKGGKLTLNATTKSTNDPYKIKTAPDGMLSSSLSESGSKLLGSKVTVAFDFDLGLCLLSLRDRDDRLKTLSYQEATRIILLIKCSILHGKPVMTKKCLIKVRTI